MAIRHSKKKKKTCSELFSVHMPLNVAQECAYVALCGTYGQYEHLFKHEEVSPCQPVNTVREASISTKLMTSIQFWTGPSIIFIHHPHPHSISPQGLMQASFWEPTPSWEGKRATAVWWTGLEVCTTSYFCYEHAWPWQNCISMSSSLATLLFWGKKEKKKNEHGPHLLFPNCLSYKHCWLQFITRAMANTRAGITKSCKFCMLSI